MEHAILALKIAMAILIPDVPEEVLFEESRNAQISSIYKYHSIMLNQISLRV